jgi:hypothetical protein
MYTWSLRLVYWYPYSYFKVFYVVTYYKITGCWFASSVWFISTSWVLAGLLSNPTQLLYNQPSLMVASCFPAILCCSYLIFSMNGSCKRSSY